MRVGSLFSGIGGFDLGFERAGMQTVWQVEQDAYCRAVLEQHFPDAERFEDVRDVGARNLAPVDVICGGFPCQDLSVAGKGAGIDGARSGLWSEFARIIGELRPRYVAVENVPALTRNEWLGRVLGDLAALGYDAEWDCIPAAALGAPHRRDRIWLVAYPGGEGRRQEAGGPHGHEAADEGRPQEVDHVAGGAGEGGVRAAGERGDGGDVADAPSNGRRPGGARGSTGQGADGQGIAPAGMAYALRDAQARSASSSGAERERVGASGQRSGARDGADADQGRRHERCGESGPAGEPELADGDWWSVEPDVGRVADGVPARVDRLAALGNALVPQIAEWIGRRIIEFEERDMTGEGSGRG